MSEGMSNLLLLLRVTKLIATSKSTAISEPADNLKSHDNHAVGELADYYANSKPPGRRYPVSMVADMLANFIDGVAGDPPVIKKPGKARKKNQSAESKK